VCWPTVSEWHMRSMRHEASAKKPTGSIQSHAALTQAYCHDAKRPILYFELFTVIQLVCCRSTDCDGTRRVGLSIQQTTCMVILYDYPAQNDKDWKWYENIIGLWQFNKQQLRVSFLLFLFLCCASLFVFFVHLLSYCALCFCCNAEKVYKVHSA